MPAGNFPDTLRSGARPCAPLDFGPTDPFGRLDCLLLPLLVLSNMSTCGCAWSTRTDRRLSDQNDPLMGGDAPIRSGEFQREGMIATKQRGRGSVRGLPGQVRLGRGPLGHCAPLSPGELIRWARLASWPYPRGRFSSRPASPRTEPLVGLNRRNFAMKREE